MGSEIFATMRRGRQVILALSLVLLGQSNSAPKPFIPIDGAIALVEGLFGLGPNTEPGAAEVYDAAPEVEKEEEIPCGDYGSRRRKRGTKTDSYGSPELNDPCGVSQETDNAVLPATVAPHPSKTQISTNGPGKGYPTGKNCKWVQTTVFKIKYDTKCKDVSSSQCQVNYKTDCKESVSYECKTEFNEECSTTQVEECTTPEAQTTQVEECKTDFNTVTETVTEEVCTRHYEDVCTNSYGLTLNCIQVPKKVCENVDRTIEKQVPVETCNTVEKVSEPQAVCVKVPKHTCNTVPTESCANVPRYDCALVATGDECKKVPERECHQKPVQYPVTERKKVCDNPK